MSVVEIISPTEITGLRNDAAEKKVGYCPITAEKHQMSMDQEPPRERGKKCLLTMCTKESTVASTVDELVSGSWFGYTNIDQVLDGRHAVLNVKYSGSTNERFDIRLSEPKGTRVIRLRNGITEQCECRSRRKESSSRGCMWSTMNDRYTRKNLVVVIRPRWFDDDRLHRYTLRNRMDGDIQTIEFRSN